MRGRKPIPTAKKIVSGNPGRRPLNNAEPEPVKARPKAPDHLSELACKAWDEFSEQLFKMGVLTVADGTALEMLCEAYADYVAARDALSAYGSNYYTTVNAEGSTMYRAYPAMGVMQDADRRVKVWLAEFGMTPSARSRVKTDDGPNKKNKAASYLT